jgi:hypothetical protein
MAYTPGRLTYFKINAVDLSAWCDNTDFDEMADTKETTTYGKSHKTRSAVLKDGGFSVGGMYDSAAAGPEATLRPLIGGASVTFEIGPEGSAAAKKKHSGSCIVTKMTVSMPVGDMVRWKAEFQTTDTITTGVFP